MSEYKIPPPFNTGKAITSMDFLLSIEDVQDQLLTIRKETDGVI